MKQPWLWGGIVLLLFLGLGWWLWPRPTAASSLDDALYTYLSADPEALSYWRPGPALAARPRYRMELPPVAGRDSSAARARLEQLASALAAIDTASLPAATRYDWELARYWVAQAQSALPLRAQVFAFDPWQGVQRQWPQLLLMGHRIESREEIEAYLWRMEEMGLRWATVRAHATRQVTAGQGLPARLYRRAARQLAAEAARPAQEQPLYRHLARCMVALDATLINDYQATDYLIRAADILEKQLVPAWQATATWLDSLANANPAGPLAHPQYARWLAHYSGQPEQDATALHAQALAEVAQWRGALATWMTAAGPPWAGQELPALLASLHVPDTTRPGDLSQALRAEMRQASQLVAGLFDSLPVTGSPAIHWHEGLGAPDGPLYLPPAWDGTRGGELHLSVDTRAGLARWALPVLAYRLGYPGAHLRAAWPRPDATHWRAWAHFPAMEAGWEAYALHLFEEDLKFFPDGSEARLGYLWYRLHQALRLALDTGLHHQGWDEAVAQAFLMREGGYPAAAADLLIDEVLSRPGAAVAAPAGLAWLLQLRQVVTTSQGETFFLQPFNTRVLDLRVIPMQAEDRILALFPTP